MSCDPFARLDGAYSLGALDADDLAAYEAHLLTCAECRLRVEELRPTVRSLARARAAGMDGVAIIDPGPVPGTVLPALLRRAERERRRRRWVTRGIAGLAAACLLALVTVLWPPSSKPAPDRQKLVAVRSTPVTASAQLVAKPWGTQIDVHCSYARYAKRFTGGYGLRVIDLDRRSYDLGTWALTPNSAISFTGGTAVRRERIARVQITLSDGTPILQLAL